LSASQANTYNAKVRHHQLRLDLLRDTSIAPGQSVMGQVIYSQTLRPGTFETYALVGNGEVRSAWRMVPKRRG